MRRDEIVITYNWLGERVTVTLPAAACTWLRDYWSHRGLRTSTNFRIVDRLIQAGLVRALRGEAEPPRWVGVTGRGDQVLDELARPGRPTRTEGGR